MGDKITITTEKDGKIITFEGAGTLTLTERAGGWIETHPTSTSREACGVEIEWDGDCTIREVDRQSDTLEALAGAWEAAEVPTDDAPIREGDVVIVRHGGGFTVELADRILSGQTHGQERVLSRAPRREPWADLADELACFSALANEPDVNVVNMAKRLHAAGWRKGGDGDE